MNGKANTALGSDAASESDNEFQAEVNSRPRSRPYGGQKILARLLCQSVLKNRLDRILQLVELGADCNSRTDSTGLTCRFGRQPLHVAVTACADRRVIRALCEAGASVNKRDIFGVTPPELALLFNRFDALEEMRHHHADLSFLSGPFREMIFGGACVCDDVLIHASFYGNIALLDKALSRVTKDEHKTDDSVTVTVKGENAKKLNVTAQALKYAAWRGQVAAVKALLAAGVPTDVRDEERNTSLIYAVRCGNIKVARCLLQAGADANILIRHWGVNLLEIAVARRSIDMLSLLLDFGASTNLTSYVGQTALMEAVLQGEACIDAVDVLLASGATVNQQCPQYSSALFVACHVGNYQAIRKLVSAGANVNETRKPAGDSPLMVASESGKLRCVHELLLSNQINVEQTDLLGCTCLHYCCKVKNTAVAVTLLRAGCNKFSVDHRDRTAPQLLTENFGSECHELCKLIEMFFPSLQDLCLLVIRRSLPSPISTSVLQELPLPPLIIKKLMYL